MMIDLSLKHIEYMEGLVVEIDKEIDRVVSAHALEKDIELLDTIPGVNTTAAAVIVAETGRDMSVFPTEHHLCSWAGISPGNNESAGKKKADTLRRETNG